MSIRVLPHDPSWSAAFEREAEALRAALGTCAVAVNHIGSTSVPGLMAKPIIDMLAEVTDLEALDARAGQMQALGYEVMGAFGIEGRRYFRKTSAEGMRTHHLHAFARGSTHLIRHLAFRDYLRAHPSVAAEYAALKVRLLEESAEAGAYMDGKDAFVKRVEGDAVAWADNGTRPSP